MVKVFLFVLYSVWEIVLFDFYAKFMKCPISKLIFASHFFAGACVPSSEDGVWLQLLIFAAFFLVHFLPGGHIKAIPTYHCHIDCCLSSQCCHPHAPFSSCLVSFLASNRNWNFTFVLSLHVQRSGFISWTRTLGFPIHLLRHLGQKTDGNNVKILSEGNRFLAPIRIETIIVVQFSR